MIFTRPVSRVKDSLQEPIAGGCVTVERKKEIDRMREREREREINEREKERKEKG